MALDGILIHKIVNNLQSYLPAKINKIQQISDYEIILNIRNHHQTSKCLISAHSEYNRMNITNADYTTLEHPTQFVMVLRKHLNGGIIRSIEQIQLDRILKIEVEIRNEVEDLVTKNLYIELMGRYANIILVNEKNIIIDALKRIPIFENIHRIIQPGATFSLPIEHCHKKNPFIHHEIQPNISLVEQFHGFSPLLAKEISYRLKHGQLFQEIMQEIKLSNALYLSTDKNKIKFHTIPLTHLDKEAKAIPIFHALDFVYKKNEETLRISKQTNNLEKFCNQELKKQLKKQLKLKETLSHAKQCDIYREYGDLLFTYQSTIQKSPLIELPSFTTNETVSIEIDMKYSIKENANRYYNLYQKSKRSIPHLQEQLQNCEREIQFFQALLEQLSIATVEDAIEIREELLHLQYIKKNKTAIRRQKKNICNYITLKLDDAIIYVGKNNMQNEYITWKLAKKNDIWLHAKGFHGSHVVISCSTLTENLLRTAAMLAAYFSKARYSSSVPIDYCLKKDLKKIPGNKGSFVQLTSYKTIYIDPDEDFINDVIHCNKV